MKHNPQTLSATGEDGVIWVHNDPFHADEVTACAVLVELFPGSAIKRSRDPKDGEFANFAVDVGGRYDPDLGYFDHHQLSGISHPEGPSKASAGLVWQEYGESYVAKQALRLARTKRAATTDLARWSFLSDVIRDRQMLIQVAEMVRKSVILPVDVWDNGKRPPITAIPALHFSSIIHSMSTAGEAFTEALLFAQTAVRAQTTGALARVLRARCLRMQGTMDDRGNVCCPVKPYSMSWVRSIMPEASNSPVAYYRDGDYVYYVVASDRDDYQLLKNKDRATADEFERMFK